MFSSICSSNVYYKTVVNELILGLFVIDASIDSAIYGRREPLNCDTSTMYSELRSAAVTTAHI